MRGSIVDLLETGPLEDLQGELWDRLALIGSY